ncbi:endoglucanase 22-like [Triticum dicoccoides]|uniref:endoglucanase 22-like n=1 Tax=Triticum dicoccoides TaxID=85692 RepID=UPI0018911C2C|nr:endoglucanase 22-like [Triticum dicoccoides]
MATRIKMLLSLAICAVLALVHLPFTTAGGGEVAAPFDYKKALHSSLLYFEAQRSGRLPHNQRVKWRGHSGLADGLQQGVDLVGGYYDAGDNVKFGLPMAFTVTMLSWSAMEFADDITAAGEWRHVLEAIKWGTDYFVKAHTEPYVLWAEVGDGDTDHYCWQRPEDMTTSRQAYNVNRTAGGMLFVRQWNNMQYVTNAAFLLTVYSRYLTSAGQEPPVLQCPDGPAHADELRSLARAQTDYVLGANPAGVSYLVGYGQRLPRRMHHRGASIVSHRGDGRFIGCMQGYDNWFLRRGANPNVVIGAIVGGPDHLDRFRDRRDNYMQTEACTYNTAPMVGIFAHLHGETAIMKKS